MENDLKYEVSVQKFIFDLLLLIFLGVRPIYSFLLGDVANRGFFCNDDSIRYPFIPTTPATGYLIFAGETTLVSVIIISFEIYLHYNSRYKFSIARIKLPICLWYAYCAVTAFLFGAAVTRFTTLWLKYKTGELRPHFMDVCTPNVDCSDSKNLYVYHTNYTCTNTEYNTNQSTILELRQSFPCGQITTSLYCMLYLCIYLQFKMTWRGSKFLKHALQFVAINCSMYIGVSNYVINDHHALDIVAGVVQGTIFAIVTAVCLGRFHSNKVFIAEYQEILP